MYKNNSYKVVTLGQSGVGKTTLVSAYQNKRFDIIVNPTIGAAFNKFYYTSKVTECKYSFDVFNWFLRMSAFKKIL